jgi:hypothetical protein
VIIEAGRQTVSEIKVYDTSGKEVLRLVDPSKTGDVYVLDIRTLHAGLFIAYVESTTPFQGKFIKTK